MCITCLTYCQYHAISCFNIFSRIQVNRLLLCQVRFGKVPIYEIGHDRLDIFLAVIFIIDVIGVLPNVYCQERFKALKQGRIDIFGPVDLHGLAILDDPHPADPEFHGIRPGPFYETH